MNKLKSLFQEALLLERSIPGLVSALFILSIVAMNLLANKSINLPFDWLALDCGIIFSWLVFLLMDMVTKHFGPRAATMLSVIALIVNLFMALMLFIGSVIPGLWGESFVEGSENVINYALDHTFRGTWYVLLGSSVAFIVSSIVNNELNWLIVSHNFFGWTMTQCIMCAVTGAVVELICEVIFSPIGYRVAKRWKKREAGKLYIDYIREKGGRVA